jgi:hypothetical protein
LHHTTREIIHAQQCGSPLTNNKRIKEKNGCKKVYKKIKKIDLLGLGWLRSCSVGR